jgi:hypothetical protein
VNDGFRAFFCNFDSGVLMDMNGAWNGMCWKWTSAGNSHWKGCMNELE